MRILIVLLCAPLFGQDGAAIEKAVLAANAEITRAAENRDLDGMFRYIADTSKGSIIQNGVLWLTPREAKERLEPGFRAPVKVEYRWKRQLVTVLAADAALLVSEGETVIRGDSGETVAPFVQTSVWVLRDGGWKILHAHHSSPR